MTHIIDIKPLISIYYPAIYYSIIYLLLLNTVNQIVFNYSIHANNRIPISNSHHELLLNIYIEK